MKKTPFSFSILRYVHDPLTEEFANVGVVLFAPELKFISALCTEKYRRISRMFDGINGPEFRRVIDYIEAQVVELGERLVHELRLEKAPGAIEEILRRVLPSDDSSLQFSRPGFGLTVEPAAKLEELYNLYVQRYEGGNPAYRTRTEREVWKTFRKPLEEKQVLRHLQPHKIIAKDYDYQFHHAWKNQVWHACEPVSLDLAERSSILDKAATWVGKAHSLQDSKEKFKLILLLGQPSDRKLLKTYHQAENILGKMTTDHRIVREEEADGFAEELKGEIDRHLAQ